MPLAPSTRLGPYEILSSIGAGGMGEVYRARDTRLDRTVAIKVLPEHLSSNPQLRERFDREAKAISSLSHPHICPLYDVGHQDGVNFLVMEFLEGETLAHRLRKGPLAPDQVLQYAIQITDALDTAHRHGVVHRDLKPGNIMLVKTGAKLLDFGLAKVRAAEAASGMTALPTQTTPPTREGTILGTLQYMAPEQLEGKEADARTDIFALGAVIYEMATGRKAFDGATQANLIAAILERDPPPISAIQPLSPPALDRVLRICLAKNPDARWQAAHDILVQLKWINDAGPRTTSDNRKSQKVSELVLWVSLALVSIIALPLALTYRREKSPDLQVTRFLVPPPPNVTVDLRDLPAVSPDGQRFVFGAVGSDGKRLLWVRSLDSTQAQPIAGTEEGLFPFWSPDGRWIAYFANRQLRRISASGGPAQVLCAPPACVAWGEPGDDGDGGSWSREGIILFRGPDQCVHRVSAEGGEDKVILELDKSRQETAQFWPSFLPDGKHFLYLSQAKIGHAGIYIGSLDSTKSTFLLSAESNAVYAPPGVVVYSREHALLAQPFDAQNLRVTGEPVPIAEQVVQTPYRGGSLFSVSSTGVLVYRTGSNDVQLAWYGRNGRRLGPVGEPGAYHDIVLSPDERTVALTRSAPQTPVLDVWVMQIATGAFSRVTFGPDAATGPVWSPDGHYLGFASLRNESINLYRKLVGGSKEEVLFVSHEYKFPQQWLKSGNSIIFLSRNTFYRLSLDVQPKEPVPLLESQFPIDKPQVSPNEHWVAYESNESGRWEVYLATFPGFTQRRQISAGGGCEPLWRGDGKELFFLTLDGKLMGTSVVERPTEPPQILFHTSMRIWPTNIEYCVTRDGKRFLLREPVGDSAPPITVVLNWTAQVKRLRL